MAGPRIALLGAGSVVFARTLMSDILSFPVPLGSVAIVAGLPLGPGGLLNPAVHVATQSG